MIPKVHSVTVEIGGRPLILETGWLAKQAGGAVTVKQDESAVLVTAVGSTEQRARPACPASTGAGLPRSVRLSSVLHCSVNGVRPA